MKRTPAGRIIARFAPPAWIDQRIKSLSEKLTDCKDAAQRKRLGTELSQLQKTMGGLTVVKPDRSPEASRVPLPRSYIEERQAKIRDGERISGRKSARVHFVQGGAPGSGKGGKGK